jgi:hypothetical protein
MSSSSSLFGDATLFKVQVNFDITIFEGHIDADSLEKWLNLLEGYFSIHNFFDKEKITFALLKVSPPCQTLVGNVLGEKFTWRSLEYLGSSPLGIFLWMWSRRNIIVGNYDDQYMIWTMLHQKRGQTVSEFTNIFHTLHTNMGIKDSERHLVLKYCGDLHRYIQTEMEFLDISSLGATYRYDIKIENKFKHQNK